MIHPAEFNEFCNQESLVWLENNLEILSERESMRTIKRKYDNNDVTNCNSFKLDE